MSYLRSHIVELLPFVILRSMHSLTSSGSADNTQGIYFNLGERNNLNRTRKVDYIELYVYVYMPDIYWFFLNKKTQGYIT